MFANLRNRKKPAPQDTNKGKEKVDDDVPLHSKRQRNEVGDHDGQRKEVSGLMVDAMRPTRTATLA